ncbi:hypothetical protein E6C27_scaffold73G00230 [Cucumis melo var. makuwa]|uniref:Uncharacterized protein n=1 Tax=Cucumis melo var. makuwa TaxID=1194695 RepID=A0A5A7UT45_CUCMM|nr:hypothetical protein E6C27_scaffold73G00230 [Cucumis melo var. makuwa]
MTEILSLRLEITVCTLVLIDFPVPDRRPYSAEASLSIASTCFELGIESVVVSLGLLVKSVNFKVQKSVVRRLHAIFRSKVAGSPGGGVTLHFGSRKTGSYLSFLEGDRGLTLKFTVPRQVHLGIALFTRVDLFSVDSIEGHNQVSGKGFPTTRPRIEAENVVIHRGLHVSNVTASCSLCAIGSKELVVEGRRFSRDRGVTVSFIYGVVYLTDRLICASFGSTRLICASFGSSRLICASLGITRLIGVSFGITRLIRASFGITRLMCAFYETTRLLCRVRVQRGADRRGARRMREGHMDASGFLYASADVFC